MKQEFQRRALARIMARVDKVAKPSGASGFKLVAAQRDHDISAGHLPKTAFVE